MKGARCATCFDYSPTTSRILIIKTGAAGDVLRTTPLLRKLRFEYPSAEITCITRYPELLPRLGVDRKLNWDWQEILRLQAEQFDVLINLDKGFSECALAAQISTKKRYGFILSESGKIMPTSPLADGKWLTGLDDETMKRNPFHFVEEVFQICSLPYSGEEYWMDPSPDSPIQLDRRKDWVGLNTGSGDRWLTRRWPERHFAELASRLIANGFGVILLGGEAEREKNARISQQTGSLVSGSLSLPDFAALIRELDCVVTGVTLALHVAISQQIYTILLNNIFPKHEFYLFNRGVILEPGLKCQACYKPRHDSACEAFECLSLVTPKQVESAIMEKLRPMVNAKPVQFSNSARAD